MLCKHKLDAIKYAIKASFQRELCLDAAKHAIQNTLFKICYLNLPFQICCASSCVIALHELLKYGAHTETFFFWPCLQLRAALGHETYQEVFDAAVTHHYLCFNFFISLYFF